MLETVPGADFNLGSGQTSAPVHNDRYDCNDAAIQFGARLVERTLPAEPGPT